jgi:hypothetical protein
MLRKGLDIGDDAKVALICVDKNFLCLADMTLQIEEEAEEDDSAEDEKEEADKDGDKKEEL